MSPHSAWPDAASKKFSPKGFPSRPVFMHNAPPAKASPEAGHIEAKIFRIRVLTDTKKALRWRAHLSGNAKVNGRKSS